MTTKMISEETLQPQAQEEARITPRDLRRVFWRSFQMEFSWNYERQMNLAFVYALIPVLKKLYPRKEELAGALKRHLVFFNTTPHIVTLLLGITTAMEEKNSQQKNMDANAIDNVKASLMGPLAGLGDSFFWGTLRLIAISSAERVEGIDAPTIKEGGLDVVEDRGARRLGEPPLVADREPGQQLAASARQRRGLTRNPIMC